MIFWDYVSITNFKFQRWNLWNKRKCINQIERHQLREGYTILLHFQLSGYHEEILIKLMLVIVLKTSFSQKGVCRVYAQCTGSAIDSINCKIYFLGNKVCKNTSWSQKYKATLLLIKVANKYTFPYWLEQRPG